jgi:hypothetical protein
MPESCLDRPPLALTKFSGVRGPTSLYGLFQLPPPPVSSTDHLPICRLFVNMIRRSSGSDLGIRSTYRNLPGSHITSVCNSSPSIIRVVKQMKMGRTCSAHELTPWRKDPKVHHRTHNSPSLVPVLSQSNPIPPQANLPKSHSDPIFPPKPCTLFSPLPCVPHAPPTSFALTCLMISGDEYKL